MPEGGAWYLMGVELSAGTRLLHGWEGWSGVVGPGRRQRCRQPVNWARVSFELVAGLGHSTGTNPSQALT